MAEAFTLGGRTFALAEQTTSRQDGWLMVQLEDAGILDLMTRRNGDADEQAIALKILTQARRSQRYELIIAAMLVEADKKWTIDSAKQNADAFAEISDPAEKVTLAVAFANGLTRFFLGGSGFSALSQTASIPGSPDAPTPITNEAPSTDETAASGPTPPDGSPTATETSSN